MGKRIHRPLGVAVCKKTTDCPVLVMATPPPQPSPPAPQTVASPAPVTWVDSVCKGPCAEFFEAQPALHRWKGTIIMYLILATAVILALIYQYITRRLAMGPVAPEAPPRPVARERAVSPKKEAAAAAPKSPRSRVTKKAAPVVEEVVAAPVASPKARKSRKSVAPAGESAPVESEPAVASYVPFLLQFPHLSRQTSTDIRLQHSTKIVGT